VQLSKSYFFVQELSDNRASVSAALKDNLFVERLKLLIPEQASVQFNKRGLASKKK
jgi:hypothetical protein